jgi:RimJ/RimL family protein N-acetyltransferase
MTPCTHRGKDDVVTECLRTDRLILRAWLPGDVDFVHDMYSRWEVQRFIGRVPRVMESRDEAEQKVASWRSRAMPAPQGIWAVADKDTGCLLGTVMLKDIPASSEDGSLPPSGDIEIGWHFHPNAWGRGYATEAAHAVLRHGFDAGLQEVVAVTHAENVASQLVCRRIGMTHEGQTSRYYDTTCELFTVRPEPLRA